MIVFPLSSSLILGIKGLNGCGISALQENWLLVTIISMFAIANPISDG